ncbi:kinesin-like protein KIN-5C isoform X2 [Gastrolobium bilobum]|uniref:kinesin-like protein KIN-5C isoform X2 n=1 Tax=Gastrolobium bilobum TaxID=150636 RepID=UPI002AB27B20|nr:kinesin-like protein KIN-5C isoform X2 [Gastrolobium bilobum]
MSGKEKGVNVQVLLRCRPFSDEELRSNAPQVVTCSEYNREVAVSQNIAGKHIDRVFTFDKVFGPSAQQKDLYEQAVTPIVNEVLEGFNCTIFAYGQTGTGKTYTMEGECKRSKSGPNGELPPGAGVIPRAVKQIFDTLESQNAEYSVKVTFLELYNEEITDLLAPEELSKVSLEEKQKKQLPLMEDGKGGVLVRGLEEEIVTSASEIFTLLERGSSKRRTAETLLNKQSSRSHSLFSITIHIKEATPEGEELIKCGKLNLVDLAGSENISRSGAREGRAREAGEINKSLLTLGRVINALVEHLGHIPYRDSKLTRLLRDSLGGRTKTCIIATVSPAVHCLEETLSTLDYAHRAKNIRNKPEVNQKMMKSTLIKDLYGEIERLKAEVYATREKNGVYIPKERYYQEENEKKAMSDQIEQMGITIEAHQKQLEDLQNKYIDQVRQCSDLSNKLDTTEKNLKKTDKLLANKEEDLRKCQFTLKEKDFIISEQRKAENALAHQACVLRADLEKALEDNASLFLKIGREDRLNSDNRAVVNNFQAELAQQVGSLCNTVATSLSEQIEQLQCVEKLCHSFLGIHDKAVIDLKKKVTSLRALYISHIEAVQNVVRLHKASSDATLEELSSVISSNGHSIEEFLASEATEAGSIFDDLQSSLSTQQDELALFARELRHRFNLSVEQINDISESSQEFVDKLFEESKKLEDYASQADQVQMKSIAEFKKVYEEQSRSDTEKLIADMTSLVSNHIRRQKDLVDAKLVDLRESGIMNKSFLDGHVSSMGDIVTHAKRKWQAFCLQAEKDAKDTADYSAAKHCRMEVLLQQSVNTSQSALDHSKRTHEAVNEMGTKHISATLSLIRNASDSNEQHVMEIDSARVAAEEDVAENSEDLLEQFDVASAQERESISGVLDVVSNHANTLETFREDHAGQAASIEHKACETFQQQYRDYEPSGTSPIRCEPDVPSKGTIESLRSLPIDALLEEFRENNSCEISDVKELKPSLIPRSPLIQLN